MKRSQAPAITLRKFTWDLGIKLRSLCLQGKDFASLAISPQTLALHYSRRDKQVIIKIKTYTVFMCDDFYEKQRFGCRTLSL